MTSKLNSKQNSKGFPTINPQPYQNGHEQQGEHSTMMQQLLVLEKQKLLFRKILSNDMNRLQNSVELVRLATVRASANEEDRAGRVLRVETPIRVSLSFEPLFRVRTLNPCGVKRAAYFLLRNVRSFSLVFVATQFCF